MKPPDYITLETPELLSAYVEREWAGDCRIDRSEMERVSAEVPELHNKFYRLLRLARKFVYDRRNAYGQLRQLRWEYWTGKLDDVQRRQMGWEPNPLRLTPTEVKDYIQNDKVLHQAHEAVETAESILDYLTEIVKQLNTRNYACKNVIDALRFSHGQL